MMKIKVLAVKLVIGRHVYKKDDVFECPTQEARMLIAMRKVERVANRAETNSPTPKAPTIPSGNPTPKPVAVAPAVPVVPKPVTPVAPVPPLVPAAANPVGAMQQPQTSRRSTASSTAASQTAAKKE